MVEQTDITRRSFLKGAVVVLGGAGLVAAGVELSNKKLPETGRSLLEKMGFDPNNLSVVPIGQTDKAASYRAITTAVSSGTPPELRRNIEGLSSGRDILEIDQHSMDGLSDAQKQGVINGFKDKGMGDVLMAGGILFGGLERLRQEKWAGEFLDHLEKRRDQEIQQCSEGRRDGVGHRKLLTMVLLGSAAAALAANEPGVNGVVLQIVGKTAQPNSPLNMIFSVPQNTLDNFLQSIGSSRADLMLTNLVTDPKGNLVMRMISEEGGTGTAYFLTKDVSSLADTTRQIIKGVSQYGKLVENDGTLSQYLLVLAGLKGLWKQAKNILGGDYNTICQKIGKSNVITPMPSTEVPSTEMPNNINSTVESMLNALGFARTQFGAQDVFLQPGAYMSKKDNLLMTDLGDKKAIIDMSPIFSPKN